MNGSELHAGSPQRDKFFKGLGANETAHEREGPLRPHLWLWSSKSLRNWNRRDYSDLVLRSSHLP